MSTSIHLVVLLIGFTVEHTTMSSIFNKKTTCLDFRTANRNSSSRRLSWSLPRFYFNLTHPLKNGSYELRCNGGRTEFCQYTERTERPCPAVSLGARRVVVGIMKFPGILYTLSSCQFYGRANQTEVLKSMGDIEGMTDGVEIRFVITSLGLRYSCRLQKPRLRGNFAFFPPKFFQTETKMVDGMNKLYIREGIIKAINGHLSRHIARFLSKKFECSAFFRISRH